MELKTIFVPNNVKPLLAAKFGVRRQTVWNALEAKTSSKTARLICREALNMGGFYVED